MPNLLSYHWRRLGARLHRLRIALHARGLRGALARARAVPSLAAPTATNAVPAVAPEVEDDRPRILVIDVSTPTPDRDSGSLRAVNLMRVLLARGYAVDFLPDDRADAGGYTRSLRAMGVRVHCGARIGGYPRWLARRGHEYRAVVVCRYHLGEFLIPLLRASAPGARVVLDTVDLHHLREQREAQLNNDRVLARLAHTTRRRELAAVAAADVTWVVSPVERALLLEALPAAHVQVLPNLHEVGPAPAGHAQRAGLLFIGGARHPPNLDAARWLLQDIFPIVRRQLPDCELHLVGAGLDTALAAQWAQADGVRIHGHVPDLAPLLGACRIGVAPLRFGAGVKGKVNLCMAAGLPMVLTSCAAEGMHLIDGQDAAIADDPQTLADAIVRIDGDPLQWQRLSDAGMDNVRRHFSLASAHAALDASLPATP